MQSIQVLLALAVVSVFSVMPEPAAAAPAGKTAVDSGKQSAKSALPKVLDFSTSWCAPCKKFAPLFDKVAGAYKGKVEFLHYDAEKGEGKVLADKYSVNSYPTVIFLDKSGKQIAKVEEIMKEADLVKRTDALIQ